MHFEPISYHILIKGEVGAMKPVLSLPLKYFTDHSKAVLLLWIIFVITVLFALCFRARLFINALWSPIMPCGYLLGKG